MSKTLSWQRLSPPRHRGFSPRHMMATALRMASAVLARAARRLREQPDAGSPRLPVVEFHAFHLDGGAPEGALYVDGELVGFVQGVSRL